MALLSAGERRLHLARWSLILGCIAGTVAGEARAQEVPGALEEEVKAAYLLNFTRYVDWPPGSFPDAESPVNLCVFGDARFGEIARRTVDGRRSRGRPVRVLLPDAPDLASGCHVAFVGGSRAEIARRLAALAPTAALTVGDGRDFLDRGGIITFVIVNETVRFEIHPDAARRAGLELSSRLLALATRLHPEPKAR